VIFPPNPHAKYFAGVDVQISRGLAWCLLNDEAESMANGWVDVSDFDVAAQHLYSQVSKIVTDKKSLSIGIDAPRLPLIKPRAFYWDNKKQTWRAKRSSDKGYGRHCEVIIKAVNLGNIQWTPLESKAPPWMLLGFSVFRTFEKYSSVHEVFPTATYKLLNQDLDANFRLSLTGFQRGPKDMLDAYAAALTVYEFEHDRGCQVGDGDGLGTIVLPRPVRTHKQAVLEWPTFH
jgi:hypothetical protein